MREIVLDTETTGLKPGDGHRLVEIGCVELVNHVATGNTFHCYINPERDMPHEAFAVHGLSQEFLSGHPVFADVCDAFLEFVGDATLIIHNAAFDMAFLNHELTLHGKPALPDEQAVDTLAIAKRKHPTGPNSLDALCRRYSIDNAARVKHGALLDAELLAEVYLELIGGRQPHLTLVSGAGQDAGATIAVAPRSERPRPLAPRLTPAELEAHRAFVATLGSDALWLAVET